MTTFWIILAIVLLSVAAFFAIGWLLVVKTFKTNKDPVPWELDSPAAKDYQPFEINCLKGMKIDEEWLLSEPREKLSIETFDKLQLDGYLLPSKSGNKKIQLHSVGFVEDARLTREGSCPARMVEDLDHNVIIYGYRGIGRNGPGNWFTYGWYERDDLRRWIDFTVKRFGPDCEIYLTGVSAGALITMLTVCDDSLPSQVKGVIFNSGFCSIDDLIVDVAHDRRSMDLPPIFMKSLHFFAKLYLGMDMDYMNIFNRYKALHVPVLFIQGKNDTQFPMEKFYRLVDACPTPHQAEVFEHSAHGTAQNDENERFIKLYADFMGVDYLK